MTSDDRKKMADELREALSYSQQRHSPVYLSQFQAALILELLDEEASDDR